MAGAGGEVVIGKIYMLQNLDHLYLDEEVADLLKEAESLGFSLEKGSELEGLTVRELEVLVKWKQ